jgi:hypothetical protein
LIPHLFNRRIAIWLGLQAADHSIDMRYKLLVIAHFQELMNKNENGDPPSLPRGQ